MSATTFAIEFNNGKRIVGAVAVSAHPNGNLDLHAAEADTNDVKLFENVPEGNGGFTWSKG